MVVQKSSTINSENFALVTLDWIRGRRPALTSLLCISPASDTRRPGARCRPGHSMSRHWASSPHSAATNKYHALLCQTYFRLHQASANKVGLRTERKKAEREDKRRLAFFELLTEPKIVFMIDTKYCLAPDCPWRLRPRWLRCLAAGCSPGASLCRTREPSRYPRRMFPPG